MAFGLGWLGLGRIGRPGGPRLGPELLTNVDFTTDLTGWSGTNWAYSAGGALHTAGAVFPLSQTVTLIPGARYLVRATITARTAGAVLPLFVTGTNVLGAAVSVNGEFTQYLVAVTGNNAFGFSPSSPFDGSIDSASLRLVYPA